MLLAVVLALLAQATLPHVHPVGAKNDAAPSVASVAAVATQHAEAAIVDASPTALPEHAESRCPICQTLSHAHDLLPAAALAFAHLEHQRHSFAPTLPAGPSHEPGAAHAPRSPPVPA